MPVDPADFHFRVASRLSKLPAASRVADETIHRALGRSGEAPCYTADFETAQLVMPPGYRAQNMTSLANGQVYVAVWAGDKPHVGQWGATEAIASCGAALHAQVMAERLAAEASRSAIAPPAPARRAPDDQA